MSAAPPALAGLDLAKRVFQVQLVDERGEPVGQKKLRRDEVLGYFGELPPMVVAMEAASNAYHWAEALARLGHTPRLLHPTTVSRIRANQKNDANDARAICLACSLPNARYVPVRDEEHRVVLALHALRQGLTEARTALSNQVLSVLADFGQAGPRSARALVRASGPELTRALRCVPKALRPSLREAVARLRYLARQRERLEERIRDWHDHDARSIRLETVPGLSYLTASALCATIGADVERFPDARSMSAWLGLVPRQHSTGGRAVLGHIGHGNDYVRQLLYLGSCGLLMHAHRWGHGPAFAVKLLRRGKPTKVVAVAVANKLVRTAWALLRRGTKFEATSEWQDVPFERPAQRTAPQEGE